MSLQVLEVTADLGHADTLKAIGEQQEVLDLFVEEERDHNRCQVRYVCATKYMQELLDVVQSALGAQDNWRAVVLAVEASVPGPAANQKPQEAISRFSMASITVSREAIFNEVNRGARLDINFLVLTVLSAVVAAIGLLTDNVAVVIGAMVIAPLLGPNLAFAFAIAVGDRTLMLRALGTNVSGILLSLAFAFALGMLWSGPLDAPELLQRTVVGWDSIALALASGAAAVLSLTTGLSSTLVGVMVAVALLPPAAALGIMLGAEDYEKATAAALLLGVNVVCVNLVAQIVFVLKGIGPRTWAEQKASRPGRILNATMWLVMLAALVAAISVLRDLEASHALNQVGS